VVFILHSTTSFYSLQSAVGTTNTVTLDFNPVYKRNSIVAEVKYHALDFENQPSANKIPPNQETSITKIQ